MMVREYLYVNGSRFKIALEHPEVLIRVSFTSSAVHNRADGAWYVFILATCKMYGFVTGYVALLQISGLSGAGFAIVINLSLKRIVVDLKRVLSASLRVRGIARISRGVDLNIDIVFL